MINSGNLVTEEEVELSSSDENRASAKSKCLWDFCFSLYLRKVGASANSQPNFKDRNHISRALGTCIECDFLSPKTASLLSFTESQNARGWKGPLQII